MECDRYSENGQGVVPTPRVWSCGFKRKFPGDGGVRLDIGPGRGAGARGVLAAAAPARRRTSPRPSPRAPLPVPRVDTPFMNNMDEITFWILTKRAPCLLNYENQLKKQSEEAHCSKIKPKSIPSAEDVPPPKKKKKRKLTGLDDDSESTEKPNIFFSTSQLPKCRVISDEKSETIVSDVDFNIKNSSVQVKAKKKPQKNSRTTLHKKNKVVITSTPKANLRRSLRNTQTSHLNSSFEIFNMNTTNGNIQKSLTKNDQQKITDKKKCSNPAPRDHSGKKNSSKPSNGALNGQFEDLSDVSGFTANYIRSTKLNSKTPRKQRTKSSRNLVQESQQNHRKGETSLVVSLNKAVNTGEPHTTILNCSTDSSQNIINLVSTENDSRPSKVDQSTSLLKFMDSNVNKVTVPKKINRSKKANGTNLEASFQSSSTTGSRYPKRQRNTATEVNTVITSERTEPSKSTDKRQKVSKNSSNIYSKNTDAVMRARGSRSNSKRHTDSVFVLSNSTEQVSSTVTMNVASPAEDEPKDNTRKKRVSKCSGRVKKSLNKTGQSTRDSFREKSGFAACFSDSDDDKPLKPQKYLS